MMRTLLCMRLLFCLFSATVWAQGRFTQPSGSDGSTTFNVGDTINIAWSGTTTYTVFSMGLYSSTNQTISWLISDSKTRPSSFQWKVDVRSLGFDLSSSHVYRFYACNGTYADKNAFSHGFDSVLFNINEAATTTTSTPSATPTSIPATTTSAGNIPSGASTHSEVNTGVLSEAAKAGIAVGVAIIVIAVGLCTWLFLRRRRRCHETTPNGTHHGNTVDQGSLPDYTSPSHHEYYSPKSMKMASNAPGIHEIASGTVTRAQLPAEETSGEENTRPRAELPGSHFDRI